jgi:hypothetical protein
VLALPAEVLLQLFLELSERSGAKHRQATTDVVRKVLNRALGRFFRE